MKNSTGSRRQWLTNLVKNRKKVANPAGCGTLLYMMKNQAKIVGHVGDAAGHGTVVPCTKCGTDLRDDHGFALSDSSYICRNGEKCSLRQTRTRLDALAAKGQKPRWR